MKSNLELSSPDSLDVQISELSFNLTLYKNQLEESILNSQSIIQNKALTMSSNFFEITKEYHNLQELFDSQVQNSNGNTLDNLKINEVIYTEINEISMVKTRLNDTLQMMDSIMSLDFHLEEILVFFEEKNLKDLQLKIENLAELFKLIAKLPFLDSRREKFETVVQKIKEFLTQIMIERFNEIDRMSFDLCLVYKILKDLSMEYLFFEHYNSVRFESIFKNFVEACKSLINNEELDFTEIFCETVKKEIDYFSDLFTNKLSDLMSEILREISNKLMKYLIDSYYIKVFNSAEYQEKLLIYLNSYLKICKFLMNQIENGIIHNKNDINSIETTCFSMFSCISFNILHNEFSYNNKLLLRKIPRKSEEFETFEEKIMGFPLLKLPEIIDLSFRRINELLFGSELDEWLLNFQKITEEIFQKFNRLFDELEYKAFSHALLDNLLVFSKGFTKKEDNLMKETDEKKLEVGENLSLIEVLLNKYEELIYLEEIMAKLDKEIRRKIIENSSENFVELYVKIQKFIFDQNKPSFHKRKNLILLLKTGLFLFESLFNSISQSKKKIKKIILKIFLADSLKKMQEMANLPVWKESENRTILSFSKITDQISSICQNFFMHMQIFEEIKKGLFNNSIVSNFLDSLDVNKEEILKDLYRNQLKFESYMFENEGNCEEKIEKKCDMTKFWGTVYAHFLVKIFCFCLKNHVNEIGSLGRKQLKIDIEYIMNVLQEYLSDATKGIMEELMSFLNAHENKKVLYLKRVSQSDLGFI